MLIWEEILLPVLFWGYSYHHLITVAIIMLLLTEDLLIECWNYSFDEGEILNIQWNLYSGYIGASKILLVFP